MTDRENELLQRAEEQTGEWGDAAHLSRRLGVPTAGMGSGEPGEAHSAGEYVVLDELVAGARSVALTMLRVMQAEKSPV